MYRMWNDPTLVEEPTKEEEEDRPTVPELEDFEEEELDDIFDKLQSNK